MRVLVSICLLAMLSRTSAAQDASRSFHAGLQPYASCGPAEGPEIRDSSRLPPVDHVRTIVTLLGPKQISATDGVRVSFAFPGTDEFANLRTEVLPVSRYAQEKSDLLLEFNRVLASNDDNTRNYALKPVMAGFEIYGMDRSRMEGGVMGYYLLFDRAGHTVTSVYFDNQDPGRRKFHSVEEYAGLRNRFLSSYTSCVRTKLTPVAAPKPVVKKRRRR